MLEHGRAVGRRDGGRDALRFESQRPRQPTAGGNPTAGIAVGPTIGGLRLVAAIGRRQVAHPGHAISCALALTPVDGRVPALTPAGGAVALILANGVAALAWADGVFALTLANDAVALAGALRDVTGMRVVTVRVAVTRCCAAAPRLTVPTALPPVARRPVTPALMIFQATRMQPEQACELARHRGEGEERSERPDQQATRHDQVILAALRAGDRGGSQKAWQRSRSSSLEVQGEADGVLGGTQLLCRQRSNSPL